MMLPSTATLVALPWSRVCHMPAEVCTTRQVSSVFARPCRWWTIKHHGLFDTWTRSNGRGSKLLRQQQSEEAMKIEAQMSPGKGMSMYIKSIGNIYGVTVSPGPRTPTTVPIPVDYAMRGKCAPYVRVTTIASFAKTTSFDGTISWALRVPRARSELPDC